MTHVDMCDVNLTKCEKDVIGQLDLLVFNTKENIKEGMYRSDMAMREDVIFKMSELIGYIVRGGSTYDD